MLKPTDSFQEAVFTTGNGAHLQGVFILFEFVNYISLEILLQRDKKLVRVQQALVTVACISRIN